ncbi:MAG: hypothetical protein AAFN04_13440 [Pseudomonadota bacterium]
MSSPSAIDFFEDARLYARTKRRGPGDFLRIEALEARLRTSGVAADDPEVCLWLEAALCREEADVAELRTYFRTFSATTSDDGNRDIPEHDPPPNDKERLKAFLRKWWPALALLAVAAVGLAWVVLEPYLFGVDGTAGGATQDPVPTGQPASPDIKLQLEQEPERLFDPWRLAGLQLIPIAIAALYLLWRARRLMQLRNAFEPRDDNAITLEHKADLEAFFSDRAMRKDVRRLGLHRLSLGDRINSIQSVRETVRAGGLPTIAFADVPRTPAYIVIIERESHADHLTVLARAFVDRMKQEDVTFWHYEFFGSPETLIEIDGPNSGRRVRLTEVLAHHSGANVLLCMERFDLERFDKRLAWLKALGRSLLPSVFDPDRSAPLTDRLAHGEDREVLVFPFSPDGLERYANYVQSSGDDRKLSPDGPVPFDLPAALAEDRAKVLSAAHPGEVFAGYLSAQLASWLGPDTLAWLRGLAVFPYVNPAFTLHLGKNLKHKNNDALLTPDRFFKLVRLPWLRAGSFPEWVRRELYAGFEQEGEAGEVRLEEVRDAIQQFLLQSELKDKDGKGVEITAKSREDLADWLEANPESRLHDTLLMEAMRGRKPSDLAIEASENIRKMRKDRFSKTSVAIASLVAFNAAQWAAFGTELVSVEGAPTPIPLADLESCVIIEGQQLQDEPWNVEILGGDVRRITAGLRLVDTSKDPVVAVNEGQVAPFFNVTWGDQTCPYDYEKGYGKIDCARPQGASGSNQITLSRTGAWALEPARSVTVCGFGASDADDTGPPDETVKEEEEDVPGPPPPTPSPSPAPTTRPTPTPTPTPMPTLTPIPTPTPTRTPSPPPSPRPTPTPAPPLCSASVEIVFGFDEVRLSAPAENALDQILRASENCDAPLITIISSYWESRKSGSASLVSANTRSERIREYLFDRGFSVNSIRTSAIAVEELSPEEIQRRLFNNAGRVPLNEYTVGAAQREQDMNNITVRLQGGERREGK